MNRLLLFVAAMPSLAMTLYAGSGDNAADSTTRPSDSLRAQGDSLAAEAPIEKEPQLTTFVKAEYPPQLLKRAVTGTALLDLLVNEQGKVDSAKVTKGIDPLLDSAIIKAALAFIFTPAMAGGKAVPVFVTYEYRDTLDDIVEKVDEYVNFSGKAVERGTRAPLAGAMVFLSFPDTAADTAIKVPFSAYRTKIGSFKGQSLQGNDLVTVTDSLGWFAFKSVPACSIVVTITAPGCKKFVDKEKITRGRATEAIFRLERLSYSDDELVVYGKAEKKEVSQRTLTLNEVRKIPGFGGDAVKVVQALPGVARTSFASGSIIVRGSGTGDSHFYVDGVTIPVLFHFGGLVSTYNSEALASVDLYPGGFGTRYGDAMGGVIEIKGRRAKTDRFHGYFDANFFDASFLAEGPLSKNVSLLVAGRRSYIADMLDFVLGDILHQKLPFKIAPYYWDYLTRLDVDASKNQHFYLTLFGSGDNLDIIMDQARGGSSRIGDTKKATNDAYFHLGIAGWDWNLTKKIKNELHYALCDINQFTAAVGQVNVTGKAWAHYLRDELTYSPTDIFKTTAGLDIQVIPYDLILVTPDKDNNIVRDSSHYDLGPYGAYCFMEWKPISRLTLIPGLRYDYYPELDYKGSIIPEFWNYGFNNKGGISGEPSFRLTARYELVKGKTIKASAGTYNETPQPVGQAIDKFWGNPLLPAEKGSHYVAGYEWKLSELISADVQCYFNQQWDLAKPPAASEIANDPSLQTAKFLDNGKARMRGIELMLKHEQGQRFFGWLAYSLSRSERWNYDENRWTIYRHDQTHNLQLIGSYKLPSSQEIGVRLRYVTGDPTTPVLGYEYFDAVKREYVPLLGPAYSARMNSYISFDIRYEKTFVYTLWQLHFYCDVTHLENLFGKGYKSPEYGEYRWDYLYSDNIVISDYTRPAVGVRVDF
jgi:TonB family protein